MEGLKGFRLKCVRCGRSVDLNDEFYWKQFNEYMSEINTEKDVVMQVHWDREEIKLQCVCGNKTINSSYLEEFKRSEWCGQ